MGHFQLSPRASLCGLPATTWRELDEALYLPVVVRMTIFSTKIGHAASRRRGQAFGLSEFALLQSPDKCRALLDQAAGGGCRYIALAPLT
jgi:hypothetical protein